MRIWGDWKLIEIGRLSYSNYRTNAKINAQLIKSRVNNVYVKSLEFADFMDKYKNY